VNVFVASQLDTSVSVLLTNAALGDVDANAAATRRRRAAVDADDAPRPARLGVLPSPSELPGELLALLDERWRAAARVRARERAVMATGLRFTVFTRDGFRCRYCGLSVDDGAVLQADHVVPQSKGGPTTLANLVTACMDCNLGKSDRLLTRGASEP
jgi:hypothetical protein